MILFYLELEKLGKEIIDIGNEHQPSSSIYHIVEIVNGVNVYSPHRNDRGCDYYLNGHEYFGDNVNLVIHLNYYLLVQAPHKRDREQECHDH